MFAPPDASVDPAELEARRAIASEPVFPSEILEGPTLHLPHRDCYVGGAEGLIADVIEDRRLASVAVHPDDALV